MRTKTTTNKFFDALRRNKKGFLWLLIPISALLLAFVLNFFVILHVVVPSESMEPTLKPGALVVGSRLEYINSEPEVGDVVIFRHEEFGEKLLIKRIVAVSGQRFEMKDGLVFVDGAKLDGTASEKDFKETVIPKGMVLVLGDNREESFDSRFWENPFVSVDNIKAKALFTYYPKIKGL